MEAKAQEAEASIPQAVTRQDALNRAIQAAELYMKAIKLSSNDDERSRLKLRCREVLARAEEIKLLKSWTPEKQNVPSSQPQTKALKVPVSERTPTTREEIILLEGSKLHGFVFPPWKGEPGSDVFEKSGNDDFFEDPSDLKLSETQLEIFNGWKRPAESLSQAHIGVQPTMVAENAMDFVQDITTDCSVVASLCAASARACRGHAKLLPAIIRPYDNTRDAPFISANGKYLFRFYFNGCYRKVVIDDRLPTSKTSRTLHVVDRQNPLLLWPALVEKAYLKVRGGYDFPGSNSGTDLLILTGWIPEQIFLQSDETLPQQLWKRIFKSHTFGDVIITLGTGKLSRREEKGLGLAGEHDYAVMDMKETGDQQMLLVKNPWCEGIVWRGADHRDSWISSLKEALPEPTNMAAGTFWIDFHSVIQNFESLYLNWNPGLFKHRQDHHFSWTIPKNATLGSFTQNPQYSIYSQKGGTVWVLLSRHFSTGEQELLRLPSVPGAKSPLGFISLYVFDAGGKRVNLSDNAFQRGAYVDSPQTLARLEISQATAYTIVIAQQDLPLPKYSFTLSTFSRDPVIVGAAEEQYKHSSLHKGAWTPRTAGGNASSPTYPTNPQFSIFLPAKSDLSLLLETESSPTQSGANSGDDIAVHVKLVWAGGERVTAVTAKDMLASSGDYRRGCALAELVDIAPGTYTIVCSTFEPGQTSNFTLRVSSMVPCVVRPVPSETAGKLSLKLPVASFPSGTDRLLAPIVTSRLNKIKVIARYSSSAGAARIIARPALQVSIERGQGPMKQILSCSGGGEFSDASVGVRTGDVDITPEICKGVGLWLVVERLDGRDVTDIITVEVLSDSAVDVGVWGLGSG